MATDMDIFAPSDEAPPSLVDVVSTFPIVETTKEIVDRLLTWKIRENCEGKLINDHYQCAKLELKHKRLMNFTKKIMIVIFLGLFCGNNARFLKG